MAHVVDGPDTLLGATLSLLGDGRVAGSTLDEGPTGPAVADQATALLRAGRTARVTVGGDVGWVTEHPRSRSWCGTGPGSSPPPSMLS
ncbi:hypothetical protein [Streptomyces sp. Rer75]|uniref:hypothetical protein n=1 Tax=Streptomyces sp. Rer75 TaxID=2750011 RepID=UPI0027BA45BF|nr:hypothetical protein [Streptomyces sp. Rer75]